MRPAVNQEKLRLVLQTARVVLDKRPMTEKIQTDYHMLTKEVKKVLREAFTTGFNVNAAPGCHIIAVTKEFVKRAFDIMGLNPANEGDTQIYNWADRRITDDDDEHDAKVVGGYIISRLAGKLEKEAPSRKDYFYALQNMFDMAMEIPGDGSLAQFMLSRMDSIAEADDEVICSNLERYLGKRGFNGLPMVAWLSKGAEISMIARAVEKKVRETESADFRERIEATEFLRKLESRALNRELE